MSNRQTRAFFIGRATAEALIDHFTDMLTDTLSALGKFEAEQREVFRNFTESVLEIANREETKVAQTNPNYETGDLQEVIDNLRAEVAQLKVELQQYRDSN